MYMYMYVCAVFIKTNKKKSMTPLRMQSKSTYYIGNPNFKSIINRSI